MARARLPPEPGRTRRALGDHHCAVIDPETAYTAQPIGCRLSRTLRSAIAASGRAGMRSVNARSPAEAQVLQHLELEDLVEPGAGRERSPG